MIHVLPPLLSPADHYTGIAIGVLVTVHCGALIYAVVRIWKL